MASGSGVNEVHWTVFSGGSSAQKPGGAEDSDIHQPVHEGGPRQRPHRGPLHPVLGRQKCEESRQMKLVKVISKLRKAVCPDLEPGAMAKMKSETTARSHGTIVVSLAVRGKSFEACQLALTKGFQETSGTKVNLCSFNLELICSSP